MIGGGKCASRYYYCFRSTVPELERGIPFEDIVDLVLTVRKNVTPSSRTFEC